MLSVFWLALGGTLLYFGAEWLVRGSVSLAFRAGLTPLVVGLTVVAAGTSAPEMVVSVLSALRGQGGIAVGNVVGSNICNILLIAGIAAAIRPLTVQRSLVRREIPIMIAVSALAVLLLWWGNVLGRLEAGVLVGLLVASTAWSIRTARREGLDGLPPPADLVPPVEREEGGPASGEKKSRDGSDPLPGALSVVRAVGFLFAGLALLVVGADRFVSGASEIARALGIAEAVIGLSVVAIGTSLPELATSVVAAVRGETDLALGNVVGSNIFNVLGILGVTGLVHPLPLPPGALLDMAVMVATAMLVIPLARTGWSLNRIEGISLVTLYAAYLGWLFLR
jgi:cation:H+ antiporter